MFTCVKILNTYITYTILFSTFIDSNNCKFFERTVLGWTCCLQRLMCSEFWSMTGALCRLYAILVIIRRSKGLVYILLFSYMYTTAFVVIVLAFTRRRPLMLPFLTRRFASLCFKFFTFPFSTLSFSL